VPARIHLGEIGAGWRSTAAAAASIKIDLTGTFILRPNFGPTLPTHGLHMSYSRCPGSLLPTILSEHQVSEKTHERRNFKSNQEPVLVLPSDRLGGNDTVVNPAESWSLSRYSHSVP